MSEFRDLSKIELNAMSGWAMVKKPDVSERAGVALDKFRGGCQALAEEIDYVVQQKPEPVKVPEETPHVQRPVSVHVPVTVTQASGLSIPEKRSESDCVNHKFHIQTQRCVYCDVTYRKAHGKKPEFF